MTLQFTLQFGAPLSPILGNQPFFFGCTPESIFSHAYNHTIHFTYFDSESPNDNLVQVAEAHNKMDLGAFYMEYDDSQGDGNVAVITEANMTPQGTDGRANITYNYNDYIIAQFRARSEWFSDVQSLIGDGESKQVNALPQLRKRTTLASRVLNALAYAPADTKTVMHTTVDFVYNANGQVRKEIIKDNTTVWDKADDSNVTLTNIEFKYRMDANGNIIQIRTFQDGSAVGQADFTYDPNTGLLIKSCNNGCANYKENFVYDDEARLTELKFSDGSMWKFKYDGEDDQVSTADFGADYGLFTFNY
jgi:hypothetical protein